MRVLLADDQSWLRSAMRLLLEHKSNLQVIGEAHDAYSLLHETNALLPDLILLDWELPGIRALHGYRPFISVLRTEFPTLKIIALSVNPDAKAASFALGMDAFVNKAEPPEHLLATIEQIGQTHRLEGK